MSKTIQTLIDGATYAGEVKHIVVNYLMLLITILPIVMYGSARQAKIKRAAFWVLFVMAAFQVFLWFAVAAVGISVTWCALGGVNFVTVLKYKESRIPLYYISILAAVIAIIYYAFTLQPEVTVAHLAAVILGAGPFALLSPKVKRSPA
ncbi:hypothetical protein IDJ77_21415 [Mucilaginibacter sp. ZT4R22]|uniref:Uncharacterized protein n=1 Tax=Mucilaginibacter pankratovii TaxID=2772110 RepID=A0ABR7WVR6_9SPHI|nr:hypothetical protein [Mucilaginibacter pankratovii]MBD1366386.1 hypothetical protein [Mucilaginibacter pankratovii]